ncbi:MAG: META domain-containing protein [Chromatiales bacterium]|nr:META domain-containing protein [Chromatiales bacterium]
MPDPLRALIGFGLLLVSAGQAHAQTETPESSAPSAPIEEASTPEPVPAPFEGLDWRLTTYRSESGLTEVEPRSPPTEFRFEDGRFSGSTGCNRVQGGYEVEGTAFRFGEGLAATRMACPEPVMKQETAIFKALQGVTRYRHAPDRLELTDDRDEAVLGFNRIGAVTSGADGTLEGRTWVLEAYADAQGTLVKPIRGATIDLSFDPRGRISGSDGCNRYLSGFTRAKASLSFGPIATTRMACTATDGRAEQARAYAEQLGRVNAYRIEDGRLTLLDAKGAILARFRAAPSE